MPGTANREGARASPRLEEIHGFVLERLDEVTDAGGLVRFHSVNKYLIMAHSPLHLNALGNIVANHVRRSTADMLDAYGTELRAALTRKPTVQSHHNALQHIFGHFSGNMSKSEKRALLGTLDRFAEGNMPVGYALQILKECTAKYEKLYLSRQTYFLFFADPVSREDL